MRRISGAEVAGRACAQYSSGGDVPIPLTETRERFHPHSNGL